MGRFLAAQPGVRSIGVVGWSLGAQDTVLALALDGREAPKRRVFSAGLQWSGPADHSLQRTLEIARGNHAYVYDRRWQQRAVLLYFKTVLPGASGDTRIGTMPTVNRTPGGAARSQLIDLGAPTPARHADAQAAPFACDTAEPPPPYAAP
jgi:hypothetical protein